MSRKIFCVASVFSASVVLFSAVGFAQTFVWSRNVPQNVDAISIADVTAQEQSDPTSDDDFDPSDDYASSHATGNLTVAVPGGGGGGGGEGAWPIFGGQDGEDGEDGSGLDGGDGAPGFGTVGGEGGTAGEAGETSAFANAEGIAQVYPDNQSVFGFSFIHNQTVDLSQSGGGGGGGAGGGGEYGDPMFDPMFWGWGGFGGNGGRGDDAEGTYNSTQISSAWVSATLQGPPGSDTDARVVVNLGWVCNGTGEPFGDWRRQVNINLNVGAGFLSVYDTGPGGPIAAFGVTGTGDVVYRESVGNEDSPTGSLTLGPDDFVERDVPVGSQAVINVNDAASTLQSRDVWPAMGGEGGGGGSGGMFGDGWDGEDGFDGGFGGGGANGGGGGGTGGSGGTGGVGDLLENFEAGIFQGIIEIRAG